MLLNGPWGGHNRPPPSLEICIDFYVFDEDRIYKWMSTCIQTRFQQTNKQKHSNSCKNQWKNMLPEDI